MDVYIDESGDAGTGGKGSRWLTFGAACVRDAHIPLLDGEVLAAQTKLGDGAPKPIHCTDLPAADRRGIADMFGSTPVEWTGIVIASDTTLLLPGSGLARPIKQYNYAMKYALERVSRLAALWNEDATIYIEMRRRSDTSSLLDYLKLLEGRKDGSFNWSRFSTSRIHFVAKGAEPGLCVADTLAHAAHKAIEPDKRWGHYEPRYFESMRPKFYQRYGRVPGHGFTVMPTPHYNGGWPAHFPTF